MSVLICGMEMPKDGFITVTITSDGRVVGNSKRERDKFEYLDNKDIATAVPVPPHGDLVDLSSPFVAQYYDEMKEEWMEKSVTVGDVLYDCMVYEMPPTIIPAEPFNNLSKPCKEEAAP